MSEIERLRALLAEARDSVKASLAEDGITEARRDYRRGLLERIDAALAAPVEFEAEWEERWPDSFETREGHVFVTVEKAEWDSAWRWSVSSEFYDIGGAATKEEAMAAALKAARGD